MFYFSQILAGKITDSSDQTVGKLMDILIKPQLGFYSPLFFLRIKNKSGQVFFISSDQVENLSREEIIVKGLGRNLLQVTPPDDLVYLKRDVLDQQIVDIEGARVVRVNDLRIGLFENKMCVLGIDVSFKGLLRRLGIPGLDFLDVFKVNLIDWRQAQPIKGTLKLDTASSNLTKLHPADLANIVEDLNVKRGSNLVGLLEPRAAAKVVAELDPNIQKIVINYLGPERAAKIMEQMSVDEVVDLLKMMTKEEAKSFISTLRVKKLTNVENLIAYPDNTAGGMMTTEFVSARPEWTVTQTVAEIKKQSSLFRSIVYVYITDENGIFHGAVSLRRLLLANPEVKLNAISKKFSKHSILRLEHGTSEIIKIMTKYNLFSAAVLDRHNKLMGVVTIDDVMRHLVPHA